MTNKTTGLQHRDITDRIRSKIAEIDAVADCMPGVIIIHNLQKNAMVEYMSPKGLKQLGIALDELKKMTALEYHDTYFNAEDAKGYVPKILDLVSRNDDGESLSYFQQVKPRPDAKDFVWHMSTTKILMRDDENKPLLIITTSYPIDPVHELTQKVSRLLDQNNFLRKNYQLFARLSQRENQVLRLMTLGRSSVEIAGELFISVATVETHRRNIRQKLKAGTSYELTQYAQAFDLI
ncbi:MAG: response regulator transcription factor [Bacteroidia bacterium]